MCRGSSLSDPGVISLLNRSFVSLELNVTDTGFPAALGALRSWEEPYRQSSFYQNAFANSVVLTPDGGSILGRSGGGRRWEIDSAVIYCPDKFLKYLEMSADGWDNAQRAARDPKLSPGERQQRVREAVSATLRETRAYSESNRSNTGP